MLATCLGFISRLWYDRTMEWIGRLKSWARGIKRDVVVLWLAARDKRVPWSAKLVAGAVAAYALSPIDLIPDFVPLLGYLDDLLIVPFGIIIAIKLIPSAIYVELQTEAAARTSRPISKAGLLAVIAIWTACAVLLVRWLGLI
jgi:uncharacterized membrane protein YkvA (DUF1232 family)